MNEREKLEMVKMCVDALLEEKKLQYKNIHCNNGWSNANLLNIADILYMMKNDYEYRIAKPAVKVRYRLFKWSDWYGAGIDHITLDKDEPFTANKSFFCGWLGDWQEVEIEE